MEPMPNRIASGNTTIHIVNQNGNLTLNSSATVRNTNVTAKPAKNA